MGEKMGRSKLRQEREILERQTSKVEFALEKGCTTRKAICEEAKIERYELSKVFQENEELYKKYTRCRRELVDTAADNIQMIIEDTNHKKNFEASKYVLSNYKSDLDSILESKDTEIFADVEVGNSANPIKILFESNKKEKVDEAPKKDIIKSENN